MWIRSQDRMNLVEAKRIIAYEKQGKFRVINQVLCMGDVDEYDILGEYKSKERTIEVLDEIQESLWDCLNVDENVIAKVYQMPEK